MVRALTKRGDAILREMTGDDANLMHMAIGISGEAGEFLDAVKKAVIYRKPLDRPNCVEELGDLEFFLEGARAALGVTREECLQANIEKLGKRYADWKYTNAAAQARADKTN